MGKDASSKSVYDSHIQNVSRFMEELERITEETNTLALESNIIDPDKFEQKVSQEKIDALKARFEIIESLLKESLNDLKTYIAFNDQKSEDGNGISCENKTTLENVVAFKPKNHNP